MNCSHQTAEPVGVSTFGGREEIVARVCVDCLVALPPNWGCTDCEWVEVLAFGHPGAISVSSRPCPTHAVPTYLEEPTAP